PARAGGPRGRPPVRRLQSRRIRQQPVGNVMQRKSAVVAVAVCLAISPAMTGRGPNADELLQARFRGPVALVPVDDGKTLLVANRRAGSISIVALDEGSMAAELLIGE